MSGDIWAKVLQDARVHAEHQTFGHLFPDKLYYEGKVRIAKSLYQSSGDIIDESNTLPDSSPWWFDAISRFADNASDSMDVGEVCEFSISVTIVECEEELEQWQIDEEQDPDKWSEIHIVELTKKVLVENF